MLQENSVHTNLENWQDWHNVLLNPPVTLEENTRNAYYRSKLLTFNSGINPILNAAAALLLIATRLKTANANLNLSVLYHDFCHEIKAFENKIKAENYLPHVIFAARYILCSFLDEIILNQPWGKYSSWQQQNLSNTFQNESPEGEKFFMLLERSCETPEKHLDLLELYYLCLALGYEGKYRNKEQGYQKINITLDYLYKIIWQQRGEFSTNQLTDQVPQTTVTITNKWLAGFILFFTSLILIVLYTTLDYSLDAKAIKLHQELYQLER